MRIKDKVEKDKVDFAELESGDCFRDCDGELMIKTDWEQDAVSLEDGQVFSNWCGRAVTPVNAEVHIIN